MTINLFISSALRQSNLEDNASISDFIFSFTRSFKNEKLCLIDVQPLYDNKALIRKH